MKTVFIIVANGKVSQEGYDTYKQAFEFIDSRSGIIKQISRHVFFQSANNITYTIVEVDIKMSSSVERY